MPTDYFMKIDTVPGDSTDSKHKNEIEVVSWSWGLTNPGAGGVGGGGGAGKAEIQDLHFTARTSKASPVLFINCAKGVHHKTAVLTARKPGASPHEYLVVTLSDAQISSYQVAGNENDDLPLDQVSLVFGKIQVSYIPQTPDGKIGTPITRGWNVNKNTSF
jgi:type VI secretion system secreted protein Hcp